MRNQPSYRKTGKLESSAKASKYCQCTAVDLKSMVLQSIELTDR